MVELHANPPFDRKNRRMGHPLLLGRLRFQKLRVRHPPEEPAGGWVVVSGPVLHLLDCIYRGGRHNGRPRIVDVAPAVMEYSRVRHPPKNAERMGHPHGWEVKVAPPAENLRQNHVTTSIIMPGIVVKAAHSAASGYAPSATSNATSGIPMSSLVSPSGPFTSRCTFMIILWRTPRCGWYSPSLTMLEPSSELS